MKAKQLTEQLNKVLNEEKQSNFMITNAMLEIQVEQGKTLKKHYPTLDTFGYQFEQLNTETLTGIIVANVQKDVFITNEGLADIQYSNETGYIKAEVGVEQDGIHFGNLICRCTIWIHPQNI